MSFRTFVFMKRADILPIIMKMLEESQAKEKAATERANSLEIQVTDLLKLVKALQDLLEKNAITTEEMARELKLLRPKQCERIVKKIQTEVELSSGNEAVESKPSANSESGSETDKDGTAADKRWSKAKERGNNGAKRKEYFCTEVQEHDIWPEAEGFSRETAEVIRHINLVRYEYIPPHFIKHIYHQKICKIQDSLIQGKSPIAPFQNSSFDSSFLAGMLQLRYGYSLPVERIIRLFRESGFDISKSTAHSLLTKAYTLLEDLDEVLKKAILEDSYINMDESYFTTLETGPRAQDDTKSCKVYVWCAQARHLNLIHFFYDKGSRGAKVLTDYIPEDYKGAVQSDGLVNYEILETDLYPDTLHLTCWQHCKRDFLDITGNADAAKIVQTINKLYREERKIKPEWPPQRRLAQRQKYAPPIFVEIKALLQTVLEKKTTVPKSALAKACNKVLNQFDTLCNYIQEADYDLDNNAIERTMRNISLSRRSSLFFGSHEGAKRSSLFLSLACSCKLHGIDTFDYFKSLIDAMAQMPLRKDPEALRNLLPDKWKTTPDKH